MRSAFREDIVGFCNEVLELEKYPDYGPMGLQYEGVEIVDRIATAVSISKSVIHAAAFLNAQMLIVHHGMFWNNESRILDERVGGRLELLEKYGITLLAYHLALDAHDTIGNNILAAKMMGLRGLHRFEGIGWGGEFKSPKRYGTFLRDCEKEFGLDSRDSSISYFCGPSQAVSKVAVIVGGAPQYIVEAHRQGYDTFVTGEAAEPTKYIAEDLGMNFVALGHTRTEWMGVQQLARIVNRKFHTKSSHIPSLNQV